MCCVSGFFSNFFIDDDATQYMCVVNTLILLKRLEDIRDCKVFQIPCYCGGVAGRLCCVHVCKYLKHLAANSTKQRRAHDTTQNIAAHQNTSQNNNETVNV